MRRSVLGLLIIVAATSLQVAGATNHFTKRTDVRVRMSDGVTLSADVYIPTVADGDGDGLYPCVVELTPYRKETRYAEGASYLPGAGVALIEVDARGTGGSEGEYDFTFSVREQADGAEWVEWAALQATKADGSKLCEDEVGMYGGSYSGIIQYLVASLPETASGNLPAAPPHLAAIAPQRAFGDLYRDIVYHGGMVIGSFGLIWSSGTTAFYTQPPADVSTPAGQTAWTDHLTKNDPMMVPYLANPYADGEAVMDDSTPQYAQKLYEDSSVLPRIENLRVPTLHLAGWFDSFTRGQVRTFQEAYALERTHGDRGPNFMIVGPWSHAGTHFITPANFTQRLGDWYRYWLEVKANGAAEPSWFSEPRVTYFQMQTATGNSATPADGTWERAADWPPPAAQLQRLYLRTGGVLDDEAPAAGEAPDTYVYEPTNGLSEPPSRWDNAAGGVPYAQNDQRMESGRGLTFQTAPLSTPSSIAGPIGLRMFASTTGAPGDASLADGWPGVAQLTPPYHDTDFVVKLSDVAPDGSARLITAGYLRASHRAVDGSKSLTLGGDVIAPYHPHTLATLDPPTDDAVREYLVEIWPTAMTFRAGHRIRLDVTSADTPNHFTLLKPAVNTIVHDAARPSYLSLPVVPSAG